jgi:2,4-diketo-3-deoxy-L-fuconate hydrolase
MIFVVNLLVNYVSQFMTLLPSDITTTGTPPGVGIRRKPPTFFKADDVVALGTDKLGEQRQRVAAWAPSNDGS